MKLLHKLELVVEEKEEKSTYTSAEVHYDLVHISGRQHVYGKRDRDRNRDRD